MDGDEEELSTFQCVPLRHSQTHSSSHPGLEKEEQGCYQTQKENPREDNLMRSGVPTKTLPSPETSQEGARGTNTQTSLSCLFPISYPGSYHLLNLKETRGLRNLQYDSSWRGGDGEHVPGGIHEDFRCTE